MADFIKKTKSVMKEIHWPSKKEVLADTALTSIATVILSLLVLVWTSGVDKVIDWILSLF